MLLGIWELPGSGIEPVSPALAGGLSTREPPGKPQEGFKKKIWAVLGLRCCVGFSLVAESRGSRGAVALGLLTVEASLVAEHTSRTLGPQKLQAPGSRAQDQSLRRTGLVALQRVGSSWIRD